MLLANLFIHHAFDAWMGTKHPYNPFKRYADDSAVHCRSLKTGGIAQRRHRSTTGEMESSYAPRQDAHSILQDDDRRETYPETGFDFLDHTIRSRRSKNKYEKFFLNFSPAVSNASKEGDAPEDP